MSIGCYDYMSLLEAALNGTQDDINNLGEWFQKYGMCYWNGESFDADGRRLYPVYEQRGEDDFEIVGYEFG